jgi:hypothetical protein
MADDERSDGRLLPHGDMALTRAGVQSPLAFTDRLRKRYEEWWGPLGRWSTPRGLRLRVCRYGLRHLHHRGEILRYRTDPDRVWRFCRYWQRWLLNKFNSREFALRHGCRVPALYWRGTNPLEIPIDALPDCYVIRPVRGTARQGVYVVVGEHEVMTGTRLPRSALRERLVSDLGAVAATPLLVEEFIRPSGPGYVLPVEYKFHMFGEIVAAIEVATRSGRKEDFHCQLDGHWQPLAMPISTAGTRRERFGIPDCPDEMLTYAKRLGVAFQTYVRVDCYATAEGPVFGEFSSTPAGGQYFTPFADDYFGRLWAETYPASV